MSGMATADALAARIDAQPAPERLRAYFFSDSRRSIQTVLGLIWLLDGGLQFQSFMYGKGFIGSLTALEPGQPGWLASSVNWGATTMQSHQAIFNTLAALIQVAIGLGILCRTTTKPAIALSFFWALSVWWFGEAFGMLLTNGAQPLTGAPGAVLLYALIGAIAWPGERPGGLLGVRGARTAWMALWLLMAWLWLLAASSSANAIHNAIKAAPSGMGWLSSVQSGFATITKGDGLVFALALSGISIAIAVAVRLNWRAREFLIVAAVLNLVFWVVGQGLGGMFAGGATDPNAGPLFILLAYALYTLVGFEQRLGPVRAQSGGDRSRRGSSRPR
jgi:hypothetical protein